MGQSFDDYSVLQQIPGMPILLQHSVLCRFLVQTLQFKKKKIQYWPGCPNGPKVEIPNHQKPLNT
jgi:hypothetical protein